jgi:Skp family chaperone for outer membrane proteins
VRDYLIYAHNKVIAHYQQVLRASSLTESERKRVQQSLARAETELEALRRGGNLHFPEAA